MRILLTNDDGINAPGLRSLEQIARELSDDVWIVAPETDQSGAGHSLTLNEPLRLREVGEKRFAVKGTPTDCVIMAVRHVLPDGGPDLALSGVNRGQNMGEDVTYSGTIAGAFEGAQIGLQSIALSQAYGFDGDHKIKWECAEAHGADVVRQLLATEPDPATVMNVNFPDCEPGDVAGIEITEQGKRDQSLLSILEREDGRRNPYYWIGFQRRLSNPRPGTDLRAIAENRISVTPLSLNMTDWHEREKLQERFLRKEAQQS